MVKMMMIMIVVLIKVLIAQILNKIKIVLKTEQLRFSILLKIGCM